MEELGSRKLLYKDHWLHFLILIVLFLLGDYFFTGTDKVESKSIDPILLFLLLIIQRLTDKYLNKGPILNIMRVFYLAYLVLVGLYIFN